LTTIQLVLGGAVRGIYAGLELFHRLQEQSDITQNPETVEVTRELLLDEWAVGPYHRILDVPRSLSMVASRLPRAAMVYRSSRSR
jgi:hypothetical protein